jgi:hypothetical protein
MMANLIRYVETACIFTTGHIPATSAVCHAMKRFIILGNALKDPNSPCQPLMKRGIRVWRHVMLQGYEMPILTENILSLSCQPLTSHLDLMTSDVPNSIASLLPSTKRVSSRPNGRSAVCPQTGWTRHLMFDTVMPHYAQSLRLYSDSPQYLHK